MNKNNKKEVTTDELAVMVQNGFTEMREYMDKRFEKLENGQRKLEDGQKKLENGQQRLEKGQEELKANLNKKVDVFEYKSLEYRVEKVEQKTGLASKF